jgi:hypothetical protein
MFVYVLWGFNEGESGSLVCIWQKKPSLGTIANRAAHKSMTELSDEDIIAVVRLSACDGEEFKVRAGNYTTYSIEIIKTES